MTQQHRARAQFQTEHRDVVPSVSIDSNEPLRSSEVIRMFDTLRQRIDGLRDRELRDKAAQKIGDMQSHIRGFSSYGTTGKGIGHTLVEKPFHHGGAW